MKIEVDHDGVDRFMVLKEVFSGVMMETSEGNRVGLCMRGDTIEFNVIPAEGGRSRWFQINMQTLEVRPMEKVRAR